MNNLSKQEALMNILISACLLGVCCRYDGNGKQIDNFEELSKKYHLIPVCPEQLGGLSTPRLPAEIVGTRVITKDGSDVTAAFTRGAIETLRLAKLYGCTTAILKERSPSCGNNIRYDGTFSGALTTGDGITTALLKANNITVYGETDIHKLL